MRALVILLPALVALGLVAAESYGECASPAAYPSLQVVQVGTDPDATLYLDDRTLVLGHSLWLYQESNGRFDPSWAPDDNLQQGSHCRGGLPDGGWPAACPFESPGRSERCYDLTPDGFDFLII